MAPDMSEDERRGTLIDTWASWALDGMVFDEEDRRLADLYIAGTVTLEEIISATLRPYAPDEG